MIKNYIKVTFRNMLKHKGFSFINVFGLSIGITCCILIFMYVMDELSYDRYHKNSDQIYRVCLQGVIGPNEFNGTYTCAPLAAALVQEYPEVVSAARFRNFGFPVLRYKDKVFSEERFYSADNDIFTVLTANFIQGDSKTALAKPNTLVITQGMAKKYFGNENPLGKTINADNRRDYLITGVIEDIPQNSHFHYDFLGSLLTYKEQSQNQMWVSNNFQTYFVLKKGINPKVFEQKLKNLVVKYVGPAIQKAAGISLKQFLDSGGKYGYFIQPITDIHLYSDLDGELEPNSDIAYVYIFTLIAFGILIIACINFMNLSTARAARRAREVGIRKTLGSLRSQLIGQFLGESVFMSFISVLIALILVEVLLPLFNNLSGKDMDISYFSHFLIIPTFLLTAIMVGLLAGVYPAVFLSSYKPVAVLKGTHQRSGKGSFLRSGLVIFQFSVSIILFIGTIILYNQLNYIQNKKLGFNKEQVVVIHKTDDIGTKIEPFKERLLSLPGVISASNSNTLPGKGFSSNAHKLGGKSGQETHLLWDMRSDYYFADTYQIKMAAGRYFSKDFTTDQTGVVMNETAVKTLGITGDPLGKVLIELGPTPDRSRNFKIIGIMEDFHFESLHQKIRPMIIKLFPPKGLGRHVSVRIKPGNLQSTIGQLAKTWHKFALNQAFEYTFFDQDFAKLYNSEQRAGQILAVFSILAIFVACLGLFGLAAFTTEQKTKEIGIRKTLGASVTRIIIMLSKEFTRWILLANIIAWPAAYFISSGWLNNFSYRINIGIGTFIISGILALLIAMFTVSYQSIKAAIANPVDALKYE